MRLSFVHIFFSIALRALLLALVSSIRTLLGLTPKGRALHQKVFADAESRNERMLRPLSKTSSMMSSRSSGFSVSMR